MRKNTKFDDWFKKERLHNKKSKRYWKKRMQSKNIKNKNKWELLWAKERRKEMFYTDKILGRG